MVACSILSCKSCSNVPRKDIKNVYFLSFPKDPEIKDKWIKATGNINWFPTKYSKICSLHFDEDSFTGEKQRRRLINTACPTIAVLNVVNASSANEATESEPSENEEDGQNNDINPSLKLKETQSDLIRAKKLIRKQTLLIKKLREQSKSDSKKIDIQNKMLKDLMDIFGLDKKDMEVLRTAIIKSENGS